MQRLSFLWKGIVGLGCALTAGVLSATAADVPLRAALEDLCATFDDRYPLGQEYLARLDRLESEMAEAEGGQLRNLQQQLDGLRRESLVANPLLSVQPLLFVVRPQYKPDHHNTETMFQTGEINTASFQGGGALRTIEFARPHPGPLRAPTEGWSGEGDNTKTLLNVPDGIARDPDVSFDGRKVLFSMRRDRADDYHLYEIDVAGGRLVQLTFGSGITDIDPIYLPNGQIVFTSTREPKYCMCNRHIMGNLFTMDADGANIHQIGHSTLHEGHAALMPDGRILYDRWEYVDRNFGDAQGVWTTNPDGTNHCVWWGNNTNSPGAVLDARAIPDSPLFIANFSSCHDRPWGALAIVDRRLGIDGRAPVVRTWPAGAIDLIGQGDYDTFTRVQPKYEDPYPLSEKYFLCARMTGKGEQMGIYLIDVFGNEVLLHAEGPGCFDPMPLGPRPRPPVIPPRTNLAKDDGYFYVADVYVGYGMDTVARGTVKRLRVVESPEKRFWTQPAWDGGTGQQAPGMAYDDFSNKQVLGTVPVEPDGSVYFAVPADRFVYFQLLDDRGRMVQSMRSGTIVRPGETTGCVGCHESRRTSVRYGRQPLAMHREPSRLEPWYGPPRNFSYTAEVQPVFDKNCVSCHDYGQEAGKKLNLAGDLGLVFNVSYVELRSKRLVNVVGAGPFAVQSPKSWGSYASRLAKVLLEGHGDAEIDRQIRLDQEAVNRVLTWIDINAPYYPDYASAQRDNLYGRAPLDAAQLGQLSKLTGMNLSDRGLLGHVNFTRPELSLCLAKFSDRGDPQYCEALAIITAGQQALAQHPRPDMPGFRLVDQTETAQQAKYDALRRFQAEVRAALVAGQKKYEKPPEGRP